MTVGSPDFATGIRLLPSRKPFPPDFSRLPVKLLQRQQIPGHHAVTRDVDHILIVSSPSRDDRLRVDLVDQFAGAPERDIQVLVDEVARAQMLGDGESSQNRIMVWVDP